MLLLSIPVLQLYVLYRCVISCCCFLSGRVYIIVWYLTYLVMVEYRHSIPAPDELTSASFRLYRHPCIACQRHYPSTSMTHESKLCSLLWSPMLSVQEIGWQSGMRSLIALSISKLSLWIQRCNPYTWALVKKTCFLAIRTECALSNRFKLNVIDGERVAVGFWYIQLKHWSSVYPCGNRISNLCNNRLWISALA